MNPINTELLFAFKNTHEFHTYMNSQHLNQTISTLLAPLKQTLNNQLEHHTWQHLTNGNTKKYPLFQ